MTCWCRCSSRRGSSTPCCLASWWWANGNPRTRRAPMPARRPLCSCRSTGRQTVMDAHGRDEMRKVLREYAEHVVQGWQRFAKGERNRQAGHDAYALLSVIGELKFETKAAFTRLGRL